MFTSRSAFSLLVPMLITGGFSSPQRSTTYEDFREAATTEGNYPIPESPVNKNRTLPNSGWQSNFGESQSVTSETFGGRPTTEPDSWPGTTDDFLGPRDSRSRPETSTQFPQEWSDTTTSTWGTTTTRSSLDYTTTTLSSQGGSRQRSCGKVPSPGECQAAFPRYFYNESTSQCDCYIFGGCDEGEGSYKSLEDCQQRCLPENREEGPSCKFVYVNFNADLHTTTIRTTVPDSDLVNTGASWAANGTSFKNHSQNNFESSAQDSPRSPNNRNVTTISPSSWSQNVSDIWSSNTSRSTQSTSLVTEEPLPSKCKVFSKLDRCASGSLRYYYNHTSSQCNCYNYTVCGGSDSFATLEECVQTCNPILKNQGPSCPVPAIRRFRPTSTTGTSTTPGSDLMSASGPVRPSSSTGSGKPVGLGSPSMLDDEELNDEGDSLSASP